MLFNVTNNLVPLAIAAVTGEAIALMVVIALLVRDRPTSMTVRAFAVLTTIALGGSTAIFRLLGQ